MAMPAADESTDPVTLHHVMQTVIGEKLRSHYQAPRKLSHELFVLLMQLKEVERKDQAPKVSRKRSVRRSG